MQLIKMGLLTLVSTFSAIAAADQRPPLTSPIAGTAPPPVVSTDPPPYETIVPRGMTFLPRKMMEYAYGRMVAKQTLGLLVPIDNTDSAHELIVRDIVLQISPETEYYVSSLNKTVMQALAERGQSEDRRNITLRVIRGVGVIAGSVGTFTVVGPAFAPAVAAFNGPFTQAYSEIFPDYTLDQIIRMKNDEFNPGTVIKKQDSEKVVVFLPLKELFGKKERRQYEKEPYDLLRKAAGTIRVEIHASHVQSVPAGPTDTNMASAK